MQWRSEKKSSRTSLRQRLAREDRSGLRLAQTDDLTDRKEKLQIPSDIWYKVSRSERVSYNGITPASQADNEGSIPFTRSNRILILRRSGFDGGLKKPALGGRFFLVWDLWSFCR